MTTDTQAQRSGSSLDDFSRRYQISKRHAYDEIKAGRLRVNKIGRRTIVLDDAETAWRNSLSTQLSAPPVKRREEKKQEAEQ
jgi:hypothetical protein